MLWKEYSNITDKPYSLKKLKRVTDNVMCLTVEGIRTTENL